MLDSNSISWQIVSFWKEEIKVKWAGFLISVENEHIYP